MYSSADGTPSDFHLVHLGGKALGGAALVMTEMVCVSPEGRITPGCAGMYAPEHEAAWRRVTGFVHDQSTAKIGLQLGHSGRKGSTRLMWEGIDEPLPEGNWEVCAPSPIPYLPGVSQVPRELTEAELAEIKQQFVERHARRRALRLRPDRAALRARLPAVVVHLAGHQPAGRPLRRVAGRAAALPARGVRRDAGGLARGQADDRADLGHRLVSRRHHRRGRDRDRARPSRPRAPTPSTCPRGRSRRTRSRPSAGPTRRRSRTRSATGSGIATIAVGVISSYDDVNSIILAGRADLCALGRAHLYDPNWTLHAAAEQGYDGPAAAWPDPWRAGAGRRRPGAPTGRGPGCS